MSSKKELSSLQKQISMLQTEVDHLKGVLRPESKLKVGKSYRSVTGWVVINRKGDRDNYGFGPNGIFSDSIFCPTTDEWQEIPESEAIKLLEKECVRRYGENWKGVKIKKSLLLPDIVCRNANQYYPEISINEIYNRNGCIFKDGVWAEKLEEPKLKEGQMIWVKMDNIMSWEYGFVTDITDPNSPRVNTISGNWKFNKYSILNPYPESIEARAIELLRKISDNIITRKSDLNEFIEEIDNYKKL